MLKFFGEQNELVLILILEDIIVRLVGLVKLIHRRYLVNQSLRGCEQGLFRGIFHQAWLVPIDLPIRDLAAPL